MAQDPEGAAVAGADAAAGGAMRRARKANPLANRIKRLMQTDEDVGKIAQASPALIGRALELFLGRLCGGAHSVAQQYYTNTIAAGHLKAAVAADPTLDFLKDAVEEAPNLPEPPAEPPARVARQRKKVAAAAAEGSEGEAAPPPEKPPRKPRARKRKPASGDEDEEPDAADASDYDPDDEEGGGGGRKKRQRKRAPRKAAAAAAAGSDDAAAQVGRTKPRSRSRAAKAVEPGEQPLDADEDEAAGGWHVVSDGTAAAAPPAAPQTGSAAPAANGDPVPARTAADRADVPEPPAADVMAASSPSAVNEQAAAQQPDSGTDAPEAAVVKAEAGAAPAVGSLPAYAYAGTHLVPDVEEDDYDAD